MQHLFTVYNNISQLICYMSVQKQLKNNKRYKNNNFAVSATTIKKVYDCFLAKKIKQKWKEGGFILTPIILDKWFLANLAI